MLGRQLEDLGVLNRSLKSRGNSWDLHKPLVCLDGAVFAYAWKRQLAGLAGASAVGRTRYVYISFKVIIAECDKPHQIMKLSFKKLRYYTLKKIL